MTKTPSLTKPLMLALIDCDRWTARGGSSPYWWKIKSMAKLAEMGLAEGYNTGEARNIRLSIAYRLTDKGREVLKGLP